MLALSILGVQGQFLSLTARIVPPGPVTVGTTVSLVCQVMEGDHSVFYSWIAPSGEELYPGDTDGVISVTLYSTLDYGIYTCTATDDVETGNTALEIIENIIEKQTYVAAVQSLGVQMTGFCALIIFVAAVGVVVVHMYSLKKMLISWLKKKKKKKKKTISRKASGHSLQAHALQRQNSRASHVSHLSHNSHLSHHTARSHYAPPPGPPPYEPEEYYPEDQLDQYYPDDQYNPDDQYPYDPDEYYDEQAGDYDQAGEYDEGAGIGQ